MSEIAIARFFKDINLTDVQKLQLAHWRAFATDLGHESISRNWHSL